MPGNVKILSRVELGGIQAVVPGQDELENLPHHVRLGEVQRLKERPGGGESAMARRTVGRLLGVGPGRYTAGVARVSKGATWRPILQAG